MMTECTEISVLGPIEVIDAGGHLVAIGQRIRRFLGLLVVEIGRAVSFDRIVDTVWRNESPSGMSAVHSAATRVRAVVGPDRLQVEDHAYVLTVPPEKVDAVRFERLVLTALDDVEREPREALEAVDAAIDLWRGRPYGDLAFEDPYRLESVRLTELHGLGCETLAAAALATGMTERAVLVSQQLTADLPYRDRSWELLVESLWKDGRRIEALDAIGRCRDVMAEAGLSLPPPLRSFAEAGHPD